MTLFYDPKQRKPKIWVLSFFIIIPLILIFAVFTFGKSKIDTLGQKDLEKDAVSDVWDKF